MITELAQKLLQARRERDEAIRNVDLEAKAAAAERVGQAYDDALANEITPSELAQEALRLQEASA